MATLEYVNEEMKLIDVHGNGNPHKMTREQFTTKCKAWVYYYVFEIIGTYSTSTSLEGKRSLTLFGNFYATSAAAIAIVVKKELKEDMRSMRHP